MATGNAITVDSLLRQAASKLEATSPSPRLDAEVLLGFLLSLNRLQLIMKAHDTVPGDIASSFSRLLDRRAQNEPIAYLTGEKEFYGLAFHVTPDVLVPRPETEILVDAVLCQVRGRGALTRILDLGTGSGAIPVALAATLLQEKRAAEIVAIDKSAPALAVAQRNALRHGVQNAIEFIESDWFSSLPQERSFDIIVSNPPYIAEGDAEVSPELRFEPHSALYAAEQGLSDIAQIFSAIVDRGRMPELILIEIGARQGQLLMENLKAGRYGAPYCSAQVEILPDLAGLPRVLAIRMA